MITAEREAAGLLAAVCDRLPHACLPVDAIAIAQILGIQIYMLNFNRKYATILRCRVGYDPELYLHRDDSSLRQRWYCARELGRYLVHEPYDEEWACMPYRDQATVTFSWEDRYADDFAQALLLPRNKLSLQQDRAAALSMSVQSQVPLEYVLARFEQLSPSATERVS